MPIGRKPNDAKHIRNSYERLLTAWATNVALKHCRPRRPWVGKDYRKSFAKSSEPKPYGLVNRANPRTTDQQVPHYQEKTRYRN